MKAKWQPMSSIFCCLDRIYITLTRTRHKLDHTNQLTGCYTHIYIRIYLVFGRFIRSFIHCASAHNLRQNDFSRLATLQWPSMNKHNIPFNLLTHSLSLSFSRFIRFDESNDARKAVATDETRSDWMSWHFYIVK